MRHPFLLALLVTTATSAAFAQDGAATQNPAPAQTPPPAAAPAAPAAAPAAQARTGPVWLTDFETAKATAKQQNKPIVAAFVGSDWCGYSIRQQKEVFDRPAFAKWAAEKAVLLKVDFPLQELPAAQRDHNRDLKHLFGVRGYPTVVLLDSAGKQFGLLRYAPGGVRHWLERAEDQLAQHQPQPPGERLVWQTDYAAALRTAKEQQKRVLVNFTGSDWCVYCKRLQAEVFSRAEFVAWAKEHVVLVELDFPRNKKLPAELTEQNEKLQEQFSVEGFPTVVFVDADGKELTRTGYERGGVAPWLANVSRELGIAPASEAGK